MVRLDWMWAIIAISLVVDYLPSVGGAKAHRCDPDVINKIENIWRSQNFELGYPTDIIETFKSVGPLNTFLLTDQYLVNQDEISCIYAIFSNNGFVAFDHLVNGTVVGHSRGATEDKGIVYNPENGDTDYMIFRNYRGVSAWYRCNIDGAEGHHEGGIIVAKSFSLDAVSYIEHTLYSLGLVLSQPYNGGCGPCYPTC